MNPLVIGVIFKAIDSIIDKVGNRKASSDPNNENSEQQVESRQDALLELLNTNPAIAHLWATLQESISSSLFKSGWRPLLGWVCTVGIGLDMFVPYLIKLIIMFTGSEIDTDAIPRLDREQLITMVLILLGVSGLRTVEKVKGITS